MKPGDPLFPLGPSTVCSNKGDILAAVFYASHNHLEQAIKAKRISCAITSSAEGKVLYFDGDVIKAKFKRGPYKIGYVYAGDWFDGTGD